MSIIKLSLFNLKVAIIQAIRNKADFLIKNQKGLTRTNYPSEDSYVLNKPISYWKLKYHAKQNTVDHRTIVLRYSWYEHAARLLELSVDIITI